MTTSDSNRRTIKLILANQMLNQEWDIEPPVDVSVAALIRKFVSTPTLGIPETDDAGNRIPWRLMWDQGNRYLSEHETLAAAGVAEGHMLMMAYEPRAGAGRVHHRIATIRGERNG
jgi:hypothetical protein